MVMIEAGYGSSLIYDVSDPVHPRLLCTISNTSAHLFTGDTFEYLRPVSPTETDVILHSLGSGNETVAGKLPFNAVIVSWLPDLSVAAYTLPVPQDNGNFPGGGVAVHLYSNQQEGPLFTYRVGIGDCICRFGLPPQVLDISPDGQYVAAGWESGKGSEPIAVYRVADRKLVSSFDTAISSAFWDRTGHRLFLTRSGGTTTQQSWTPEGGVADLRGAATWSYLPGVSPDESLVAYTAYSDPINFQQPRVYTYDLKAGTTRMLIDKLRSQAMFVKDGWVWYLEEVACTPADACPGSSQGGRTVYAMNLATGAEQVVSFAAGDDPRSRSDPAGWEFVGPGEFWPAS
ncbi:MAG TPA: hypothetical protein VLU92_12290 [Candidatus Dormibacteraeota bacterium]|nr:hypothetical protein [Candidatus Dormibacteraeota bacterium]